ncbi:class I SAM-dependent methyltransferase [Deinococcus sp.]|uniref:class I SAM-dependent methyltransferase n=1 Tax=Deinococcus sp. TaxID=47478 RepID=UPI002869E9A5|nr:class I SAM-dependent methyltransferase [Deinococcus sp.]
MNPPGEREQQNRRQFDAMATSYDRMTFLAQTARFVADRVPAQPGQSVLDVMTGTGSVALALAERVQPGGRVVGADLSGGMLAAARSRAAGLQHLSFVQADATALPFEDQSFDVVACASGLFFVPDMILALREWSRVLRPGGPVVYSAFGPGMMAPLTRLWAERLGTHGLKSGSLPIGRIASPEVARDLLSGAGFTEIEADLTALPYPVASPEARWADIEAGVEGQPLAAMSPEQRAQLRAEHLTELEGLFGGAPTTVSIPVIVARGVRPQ